MAESPAEDAARESVRTRRWLAVAEVGLIFLVFFIHAGWLPPTANEPHYLSKAKHYWNPEWCARDFFLNSADAHQVFYWTFGWLSLWLPFPALAWTGRLLTWALLAAGWRTMSWAIVPTPLCSVLSAGLFVALNDRLNMAGEWVVGGVEAKGFAYAFVLFALAAITRNRWSLGWLLLGIASSLHVLVGGWSTLAAAVAWLSSPRERPPFRSMLPGLVGGAILALPGLIPALMLTRNVPPAVANQANVAYVFERLPHHLLPQTFPPQFLARHGMLILAWTLLCVFVPVDSRDRWLRRFVTVGIGIAVVGFLLSTLVQVDKQLAAKLLRYYWFRTSDAVVPLGVAVLATRFILRARDTGLRARYVGALAATMLIVTAHLSEIVLRRNRQMRPPADGHIASLDDWRASCAWARLHTPADSLFLVPRLSQTFRWYTGRAEVVTRKDVPQDAAGIVEWQRRIHDIYMGDMVDGAPMWRDSLAAVGTKRVVEVGQKYGADYIITEAQPPLALEVVGPAGAYAIYRIPRDRRPTRTQEPVQASD